MDEQENKTPSFIKNRIDYKADTIWAFNTVCRTISSGKIDGISGNVKVSLITPQGMVVGNIEDIYMSEEELTDDASSGVSKSALEFRNAKLAPLYESGDIQNVTSNTTIITVRNAKLIPWSGTNKFNFAVLYLFASDISGFSIGDMQND